ncbi:dentin sialophosphoprotein [Microplitis demolitor]|uniref:dentin sialophosphoprotein n=1 Tax=Microplitis demolitor TaxID=69319 RepID=UPI0004CD0E8B|nr:dentin sialophosphoprotein [Microplitis demolitor]
MAEETDQGSLCYGPGSIAGAVIGTFLITILIFAVVVFLYRQWRKHKGNHLVLVTDPEIVEDAYAFDNPCFKDATPAQNRHIDRPLSIISTTETPAKDSTKWSSPWSSLGLGSGNKLDKRKTLDDSCLGPNATRISVISLRSRDFTGLGFNVCGNMREGIFVKDLLHRGPASESGRIHPGDRIASVKISFRSMVYEDALTILSYASPYDVELEVESGGTSSRPTTLLKKTVGPTPSRICHPLYRSQSIPEFSRADKNSAKRLFIADPNESLGSNYSTMNSTLKSSKSTPGSHTLERRHEESKGNNHHFKFGIKVLPVLDGTVHRIENQNEHNTNLERHNSRKTDVDKNIINAKNIDVIDNKTVKDGKVTVERIQQRDNYLPKGESGIDATDSKLINQNDKLSSETVVIPSEVPAEVHNAAIAARRNRKSSAELLNSPKITFTESSSDLEDNKSPQKSKRKAPAPPGSPMKDTGSPVKYENSSASKHDREDIDDKIESITDYTESLNDYVVKVRDTGSDNQVRQPRLKERSSERRSSESDTDNEAQDSFTTIELNPADITIHHTPIPHIADDDDTDDGYRKAASLGDLSKYEAKSSSTLERAQSLDMTDTSLRKRKTPLPPEDITESTEDLSKLDDIDTFDRRKLKKSSEWGTLEDAIWNKMDSDDTEIKPKIRKKSSGTLERSKSAVEIKLKEGMTSSYATQVMDNNKDCSIELYNLPLSKRLTRDFIYAERSFNPDEDNSLARIVNNGEVIKNPSLDEIELDFRQAKPFTAEQDDDIPVIDDDNYDEADVNSPAVSESFGKALRFFDLHASERPAKEEFKTDLDKKTNGDVNDSSMYAGMKEVNEEPMKKKIINTRCPYCDGDEKHEKNCSFHSHLVSADTDITDSTLSGRIADEEKYYKAIEDQIEKVSDVKMKSAIDNDEDIDDGCDIGSSVTVNSKTQSPGNDRHNVSNVSVSSGENSEDSGLVGESGEFNQRETDIKPNISNSPLNQDSPRKMTYITEIKVSPSREIIRDNSEDVESSRDNKPALLKGEVTVTSNGKSMPGRKPPVPPRRSDASKALKDKSNDKQVVYVSEYKTQNKNIIESTDKLDSNSTAGKKIDHWIYLADNKEQNPWGNGSSQPQSVTNIFVASGDEKIFQQ